MTVASANSCIAADTLKCQTPPLGPTAKRVANENF
jgi:hypothetical protein